MIRTGPSLLWKDMDLAIRQGSVPAAWAASSTVALEVLNVMMRSSRPNFARYFLARSTDICSTFVSCNPSRVIPGVPPPGMVWLGLVYVRL